MYGCDFRLWLMDLSPTACAVLCAALCTHRGRITTTGRPSLSGWGETNVLPVAASASTVAQSISCGLTSSRLLHGGDGGGGGVAGRGGACVPRTAS